MPMCIEIILIYSLLTILYYIKSRENQKIIVVSSEDRGKSSHDI